MQTPGAVGRPRSQAAREAVLRAVDDLLVEQGYAAMTMKGIADRAGVGRQTLYRWWATKAEILFEACQNDAAQALAQREDFDLESYVEQLTFFLTKTDAGASYLALLAAAQLDPLVADLLRDADPVKESARAALKASGHLRTDGGKVTESVSQLIGPVVFAALSRL